MTTNRSRTPEGAGGRSPGEAVAARPLDREGARDLGERPHLDGARQGTSWPRWSDRGASPPRLGPGAPVIGYVTIGDDERDVEHGVEAVDALCRSAQWTLIEMVHDRDDGTRTLQRPGLEHALRRIAAGDARALVIVNARRISRSIVDLGALMDLFRDADAVLVALDLGVDTSTPEGRHVADVISTLGTWEHERIVRRTTAGLEAARSRGGTIGRPAIRDQPDLNERIANMRASGMTLQEIADELNAEDVPTVRGGRLWRPSSVQTALGYRRPRQRPQRRFRRERDGSGDAG
jgi:DNA invertase Pin-like site-specific DNA recombinase